MRTFRIWMLAAILTACGTTMFTSCSSMVDNSVVPETENTGWTFEQNKDTSIKPGDDFYMHCIGTWWNNTNLGTEDMVGFVNTEVNAMAQSLESKRCLALQEQFQNHALAPFDHAESDSAKTRSAIAMLKAATNKEELWKDMGLLRKQGFQMPFHIVSLSKNGKMRLVFVPVTEYENSDKMKAVSTDEDMQDIDYGKLVKLFNNPQLAEALEPIVSQSGFRRGFQQEKWPMLVKICEGLGIDPAEAYIMNDDFKESMEDLQDIIKIETTQDFEEIQAMNQKELASLLTTYIQDDMLIFDEKYKTSVENLFHGKFLAEKVIDNIQAKYLNYIYSYLFSQDLITPEMKERGLQFVEELVQSFSRRIDENAWLSEASKVKVKDKLNGITRNVGYPDKWIEEGLPDLSGTKSLFEDVMEIRRSFIALTLKMTEMSVQEGSFHSLIAYFFPLQTINAFYAPNFNSINILPVWLMSPLYDPAAGDAYNYATITVFAHEITHGFDTIGSRWNKIGEPGSLWGTAADETEFNRLAGLLSDYFSTIEILPGIYANGKFTVAENIADLGGFEIGFDAFTNHLKNQGISGEQMREQQRRFFYAYAHLWMAKYSENHIMTALKTDNHSLNKERVNCILANVDAWYDLFDVQPGDKYYISPEKRVHIW